VGFNAATIQKSGCGTYTATCGSLSSTLSSTEELTFEISMHNDVSRLFIDVQPMKTLQNSFFSSQVMLRSQILR
jgi:hypothetical protein